MRLLAVILSRVEESQFFLLNVFHKFRGTVRDLTRSSPDSLAAALAAQPSMSLSPVAPSSTSLGMTTGHAQGAAGLRTGQNAHGSK